MATNEANPMFSGQLRDWFAGLAMQAMLSREDLGVAFMGGNGMILVNETVSDAYGRGRQSMAIGLSSSAYTIADAMMKQREAAQ